MALCRSFEPIGTLTADTRQALLANLTRINVMCLFPQVEVDGHTTFKPLLDTTVLPRKQQHRHCRFHHHAHKRDVHGIQGSEDHPPVMVLSTSTLSCCCPLLALQWPKKVTSFFVATTSMLINRHPFLCQSQVHINVGWQSRLTYFQLTAGNQARWL